MRRRTWIACLSGLLAATAVVTASPAAAAPRTSLTVTWWPSTGTAGPHRRATLTCDPAGGTLPRATAACARLGAAGRAALSPVPPATACTQIAGGPEHMVVSGRLDGRRTWVHLRQSDGCQIARYRALAFLVPPR